MPPQSTSTCCKKVQPKAGAKYEERERDKSSAEGAGLHLWGGGGSLLLLLARHARRRFCFSCGACRELIKFTRCTFPPRLDAGHAPCQSPQPSPLFGSLGKTFCQMQFTSVCFIAAPLNGLRPPTLLFLLLSLTSLRTQSPFFGFG